MVIWAVWAGVWAGDGREDIARGRLKLERGGM